MSSSTREQLKTLKANNRYGKKNHIELAHNQQMNKGNVHVRRIPVFRVEKQGISKVPWHVQDVTRSIEVKFNQ